MKQEASWWACRWDFSKWCSCTGELTCYLTMAERSAVLLQPVAQDWRIAFVVQPALLGILQAPAASLALEWQWQQSGKLVCSVTLRSKET